MVAPVAQSVPPPRSGSIEAVTALLVDGLVERGHEVTLFATGGSRTNARLHAVFPRGYNEDDSIWPWELCELLNLSAAVEHAASFDVLHYQAEYAPLGLAFGGLSAAPLLQTVHHAPTASEVALWARHPDAPFIAISHAQAASLAGLNVVATIHHAVDPSALPFRSDADDYLLFLGRFTEGKGVLEAIEAARRSGTRLILAAAENEYYRAVVAPLVDGREVEYAGEVRAEAKAGLLGGARALLYPVRDPEPFGLVLAEAMMCGTPVAALDGGAVAELVEPGSTGMVFSTIDELVSGLSDVTRLDRARVRERAVARFGPDRMVDAHVDVYSALVGTGSGARRGQRTA